VALSHSGNLTLSALFAMYDAGDPEGQRAIRWVATILKRHRGDVATAAPELGVTRQTVFTWIRKYPPLAQALDRIRYEAREQDKRAG
jgi:hypothetical protein